MRLKILLICLTLLAFSCKNDKGPFKKLPETQETEVKYDSNNAIKIYIDGNNLLYVDDEKVDIPELKAKVRAYAIANTSKSVISLKTASEASYKTFVDVQKSIVDEIEVLREALAKEKYNISLDSLTKKQLSEIRKVYPQNWIE